MSQTWLGIKQAMQNCQQFPNMSIWEHCQSVHHYYQQLEEMLAGQKADSSNWKLPKWFYQYAKVLANHHYDSHYMYWYLTYHDLGKPQSLIEVESGQRHFPNHAEQSFRIWNDLHCSDPIGLSSESIDIIGQLILHDLDLHTLKADQVNAWLDGKSKELVCSLLLATLAEIHSNADALQERDADSFKIKWKRLDKRGMVICQKIFGDANGS